MMKRKMSFLCLVVLFLFVCGISVSAASVSMSKSSVTIQVGENYQLSVLSGGSAASVSSWSSDNTTVATVSKSGVVSAKSAGSATITATSGGTTVTCLVSVVKRSTTETTRYSVLVLDTSGSMKGSSLSQEKKAAIRFAETVLDTSGRNYLAVITLNNSTSVLCNFTDDLSTIKQYVNSLSAGGYTNFSSALTKAGDLLSAMPDGGNVMKNIVLCSDGLPNKGTKSTSGRYSSSDHSKYAFANYAYKVANKLKNKNYFIYGLGFFYNSSGNDATFGKRLMKDLASTDKYFTVSSASKMNSAFKKIAASITMVTINKTSKTLYVGQSYTLKVSINGVEQTAKWSSADSSIAKVDSSGKVTGVKAGTVKITGTVDGNSISCLVTVKSSSIKLNKTSKTIYVNKTYTLKATVTGASSKVTWKSSNTSVATVTSSGKVKAKKTGTCTITATANGKSATCKITVKIKHPTYSQYFMVSKQKSKYGSEYINEYGVRLVVNDGAEIEKVGVYVVKSGTSYRRTIACTGTNITYAKYVPYLALNGTIKYDGLTNSSINTFSLKKGSDGVWSIYGNYTTIGATLKDANGNQLALKSTGISGKNTKIFTSLSEMKEWLQS